MFKKSAKELEEQMEIINNISNRPTSEFSKDITFPLSYKRKFKKEYDLEIGGVLLDDFLEELEKLFH